MCKVVSTVPRARFEKYGVDFPSSWEVSYLSHMSTNDEFIRGCDGADFLFVGSNHAVNRDVIVNSPSLRMLHVEGVGFDRVDFTAAKELGLPVCNNRAVNNRAVAEHTLGLMISSLRRIAWADSQIKQRDYSDVEREFRTQGVRELSSQHVGLIGMGAIGQETARMLTVFGCQVSYFDAYRLSPERENELNLKYIQLAELLQECDIISLHVPALPSTINMISVIELAMMKKAALLVNTSRGDVVDQEALAKALESGQIYGAAVDTLSPEPPPKDHPLLSLSGDAAARLILTPHIGGTTDEAFTRMLQWSIANMQRVHDGALPNNVVNGVEGARKPMQPKWPDIPVGAEGLPGNMMIIETYSKAEKSIAV